VAGAQSILVLVCGLLPRHESSREVGAHVVDERARQAVERRLVRRWEALGDTVAWPPTPPAA
jgi:hypothetical protein